MFFIINGLSINIINREIEMDVHISLFLYINLAKTINIHITVALITDGENDVINIYKKSIIIVMLS